MKLPIQKLDSIAGSQNYGSESKLELVRIRVEELIENNNNLRDYLSEKEATKTYKYASSVCCDSSFREEGKNLKYNVCNKCNKECGITLKEKEASKGECDCGVDQELHPNTHSKNCKSVNPPQQEESRGEKPKYAGWYCQEPECGFVCYMASENDIKEHMQTHKPQLKEESPKEDEYKEKYLELIMAVGNKYPGETRHQTALRYIISAERRDCCTAKESA